MTRPDPTLGIRRRVRTDSGRLVPEFRSGGENHGVYGSSWVKNLSRVQSPVGLVGRFTWRPPDLSRRTVA